MKLNLANVLQCAGAVSLSVGAFLRSTSLGFAVAGVCMAVVGVLAEWGS